MLRFLGLSSLVLSFAAAGDCDCSWTHGGTTCGNDDGSHCWAVCCGGHGPSPGPSPGPAPSGNAKYCPSGSDFNVDYGSPQLTSSGWHIQGGARVSSKASYNFAGGFMEFDMDLTNAHGGVNNNFYGTFPRDGHSYCDSGGSCGGSCCAEMDFTENNGNCFQATTWHSDRGGGDHGGSAQTGGLSGHVHVRAAWSADGSSLGVDINGDHHSGEGFADVMSSPGMVLYSSQWTGWVPGSCGGDGNLAASSFGVSNLRIQASVVQGPEPTKCSGPSPPSPPTPPSPPGPAPPSPSGCADYCATTGCGWTADYSCPWAPSPGAKGRAGDDGSAGYSCCCVKRTSESQPCGGGAPTPTPPTPTPPSPTPPSPTPPSPTPPSPSDCPGGSMAACMHLCPADPTAYQTCVKECLVRCGSPANQTLTGVLI